MNGRSDASTSTDDVKGRPLCLFYFSQPLGVVAAEPPRAAPCPAHLYRPAGFAPYSPSPPQPPAHMAPAWDSLWAPTLSTPSAYVSGSSSEAPRAPPSCRPDTSVFSSDAWFPSSASSRCEYPRRVVPYHALLPPLRLPVPLARSLAPVSPEEPPEDAWPLRAVQPERFSLPPIELPRLCELDRDEDSTAAPRSDSVATWEVVEAPSEGLASSRLSRRVTPARRRLRGPPGVHKPRRRARASAVRRSLTHLIERSIKDSFLLGGSGGSASSCCVRAALRTLRAAWAPPAPLRARADTSHACRWRSGSRLSSPCTWCESAPPAPEPAPSPTAPVPAMPRAPDPAPRAGASPGLLRRRYSVPETIMRKYRLAQQSNDSEEPCAATSPSSSSPPAAPLCGGCGTRAGAHGDRELMRKSALLRRLWGRAPAPAAASAPRASRSLHGSSSELRRSPAGSGWATPKRQRLEWASPRATSPPPSPGASPACSDCTFASHRAHSPATRADPARDVFARYSDLASDAARGDTRPSCPTSARSTPESTATLTESLPTALPVAVVAPAPPHVVTDVEVDRYTSLPFDVLTTAGSPPYEVLEIVVSETVEAPRAPDARSPVRTGASPDSAPRGRACNINIDEYVSNILVESLNSLSEQLESMSAAVGGAGVVVEKEIKVRLQNTGVNTIVHLSPTSNHQIIFGNEELCHADNEARDACNNPRPASPPTPTTLEPEPNNNEPPDSVNRAVLQQIQKLFHDELYRLEPGPYPGEPTLTHIESSNVDVYLEHHSDSRGGSAGSPVTLTGLGIGTGNYWTREPALVPRLSALPHSASMEVNTSSSEAEPSACTSLVDSLDDPASPRVPPPPARRLARSAVDVLDLLPESPSAPPRDRPEAFFVPITDEDCECDKENVIVADRMPDRIRERLLRRHRKRELRMESRRGGGLERARRRAAERDARAVITALVDELIAKIAQEEYKCMRIQRRQRAERGPCGLVRNGGNAFDEPNSGFQPRALHGKLSLPPPADGPRRIYQKSEIHDGHKCIEILEILEYVDDSQNSPETTNSDERHGNSKSRKSRIPIPIYERIQRTTKKSSDRRRSPPPAPSPSPPSPPPARRASVPPPAEPRGRAGSLRFRRVFDIIPEERSAGLGADSPLMATDDAALGRRVSAPCLPPALAAAPPPRPTRSAATSPPAQARASRSTMTSPRRAAPAPPPVPPPPAPRVAAGSNGSLNERKVASESRKQRRASVPARDGGARPGGGGGSEARSPPSQSREAPRAKPASPRVEARRSSSSGSDSAGSSLLCAAPRWLAARRRRPRPSRQERTSRASLQRAQPASQPDVADGVQSKAGSGGTGGWSVTVAGSCRAALPADVEMRLRFPRDARAPPRAPRAPRATPRAPPRADTDATPRRSVATRSDETGTTECWCRCCSCGGTGAAAAPGAPPPALPPPHSRRPSLTFTMKKEDSSTLPRKSKKKSSHTHLPALESAGGERRRSGKMRRACSLHCWLPAAAPRRAGGAELAVEGSAIVPELKPRAPTMSERDLTRHHTPRLYLRC